MFRVLTVFIFMLVGSQCDQKSTNKVDANPDIVAGYRNSQTAHLQAYLNALSFDLRDGGGLFADQMHEDDIKYLETIKRFEEKCHLWITATYSEDRQIKRNGITYKAKSFLVDLEARFQNQDPINRKVIASAPWGSHLLVPNGLTADIRSYLSFRYPNGPLYQQTISDMRRLTRFMQGIDYCMGRENANETQAELEVPYPEILALCESQPNGNCRIKSVEKQEVQLILGWFNGSCSHLTTAQLRNNLSYAKVSMNCVQGYGCDWSTSDSKPRWSTSMLKPGPYVLAAFIDVGKTGKARLDQPHTCTDAILPSSEAIELLNWR